MFKKIIQVTVIWLLVNTISFASEELAEIVKSVDVFAIKPLTLDFSGKVKQPECFDPSFAALWKVKDQFLLQLVSYTPKNFFSSKNVTPHEIVISYKNDDFYRIFLDEKGLHGQWLDSPVITPNTFQELNGVMIGELEIIRTDNKKPVKTVTLFEPIEVELFRLSAARINLPNWKCDFYALGLNDQLRLIDVKGYHRTDKRVSVTKDTLQFYFRDSNKNYQVQVQMIPQTPKPNKSGGWDIPIVATAADLEQEYASALKEIDREIANSWSRESQQRLRKVKQEITDRFGKIKRTYFAEQISFTIVIPHPIDSKKQLTLLNVKEPDLSNKK
jgi:hypothetical protein